MGLSQQVRTVSQLGAQWAYLRYHAYARHDPLSYLFTRRGRRDPYPLYDLIRSEGPLARTTIGGYATADHRVAQEVLRNRDFSADAGDNQAVVDLSLLELDPPDHTRLRRLVAGSFAPGRLRHQEQTISDAVDRLADDFADQLARGPADLMTAFAKPLPTFMIASIMGIPDADLTELGQLGDAIGRILDGPQSLREFTAAISARRRLDALFGRLAEVRRTDPNEDIVSDLVAALDRGELSEEEYQSLCSLVLVAGFETTVNLIGNAMAALLQRPIAWRRLVESPDLADRVIDETLRWDSPVQATARVAKTDIELAGTTVAKGTLMLTLLGGANRDPRVFERPEVFDIDRANAHDHLSFGHGIHHCLGRPLAMLEGRLALKALARRLPQLKPAGRPVMAGGLILRGRAHLPVRI